MFFNNYVTKKMLYNNFPSIKNLWLYVEMIILWIDWVKYIKSKKEKRFWKILEKQYLKARKSPGRVAQ